ncbi:hypothetical protein SSX86_012385 [Deinandra increscens subsp. villosa]|uniref:Uncharacterized protein n=1 Tax=Deinandra increscens subsp. villosa TaxID=3103831 RepID=A0AAP0DBP8_9ASTR
MQQSQGHYPNSNYAYSSNPPQSSNFPSPNWTGNSPNPRGYHGPGGMGFPSPQTHFTSGPGQGGYPSSGPRPHFTNSPGHGSGRGYPSPGPNFRNSPNHGSGQGGYPSSGPGPGPHFTNSPGHGSGRGYPSPGPNFRNSPNRGSGLNQGRGYGSGFGGGRGRGGGRHHVTAEDRPDRFFNKSMVEDPWKFLEPVVWKSLKKQWIPHSLNVKKPRVSESPRPSSSQPSLAEILAASFNEAAKDEPNAE